MNKSAGSGVIARNYEGSVIAGVNKKRCVVSARQAEIMALKDLKDGISLAIEKKLQHVILEIDSREVALMLTNKCNRIDWRIRPLVLDIQKMLKLIPECKV